MKTLTLGLALTLMASAAPAQQMLSTASPIPDGAETRFCYYEGMAYSEDAFVLMVGDQPAHLHGRHRAKIPVAMLS